MKTAFIFILYNTPKSEVNRLRKEAENLIKGSTVYFIDNTGKNKGYAEGVNEGIKMALQDKTDYIIVSNPDISLASLDSKHFFDASDYFDIWNFAMKQNSKTYYGGEIDKWRMSGGLNDKKTQKRFVSCDFITGALMVIKKQVVEKIGLFDESYFMYYEDVDYCMRARQAGFKVGIDSEQIFEHFETSDSNEDKKYYLLKNRLLFLLRYGNFQQKSRELLRTPVTLLEEKTTLFSLLKKRTFLFNFSILNLSSAINKALSFILFIFLARYLSIDDYGVYVLAWAHVGILAPLLDFGTTAYGLINLSNEKKGRLNSLISLRLFLSVAVLLITLALAFLFKYDTQLIFLILLASFSMLSSALSGSYLILTSINEKVYRSSVISALFNLILTSLTIIALFFSPKLVFVFLVAFASYNIYSLVNLYLIKKEIKDIKLKIDTKEWIRIAKQSFVYVIIGLLAGIYFKIDVLLLKFLQSESAVGIYSSGFKFYEALIFIASAYSFAAVPKLSKLYDTNKTLFFNKVKRDTLFVAVLGIIITLITYLITPYLLPLVLKGEFLQGIDVLKITIFSLPFLFISTIYLNILYIVKKTFYVVLLFAFQVILSTLLNYIFIPHYSYIASSYITVLNEIVNVLIGFTFYLVIKNQHKKDIS